MKQWSPTKGRGGVLLQSGMQKGKQRAAAQRANGLNLKGVVVAVYAYDSDFLDSAQPLDSNTANTIYVSVALYGRHHGILPRVLWTHDRSGLHEGPIRNPRPASIDISEQPLNIEQASNPANMDGDHVVVSFLEDDLLQPYVSRCIPHPSSDKGNEFKDLGQRMRMLASDPQVSYRKHRGAYYGIDGDGNHVIDLTGAHDGAYNADGTEEDCPEDGSTGNYLLRLPRGSRVSIEIDGDNNLTLEESDSDATLTLGDGAVSVAIADHLDDFWTNVVKPEMERYDTLMQAHTHLYVFGPTGPASAGTPGSSPLQFPDYEPAITSSKTKISDG